MDDERDRRIRDAQRKLTATFLNDVSAAIIGVGAIVLFLCGLQGVPYAISAVIVGVFCHLLAQRVLGRPEPK